VKSSEGARRSTRLRLQPLRKPKTSPKKKPVKLQTKMPKKPATAFFFFLDDFRKQYQEENPDVKSMREIGKTCGEKWKTMTYEVTFGFRFSVPVSLLSLSSKSLLYNVIQIIVKCMISDIGMTHKSNEIGFMLAYIVVG
jgi:hypothetical protein